MSDLQSRSDSDFVFLLRKPLPLSPGQNRRSVTNRSWSDVSRSTQLLLGEYLLCLATTGTGEVWTRSRKLGGSCCSRTYDWNGDVPGLSRSLLGVHDCRGCCLDEGGGLIRLLVSGGRFSLESGSGGRTEE